MPERMIQLMQSLSDVGWLIPLIGITQVVAGILIIIPKTRALGAIMILPIMIGILLTNIVQDTTGLPIALVLFAILLWIMYENRGKYAQIIG